jgi:hypothetical protein
MLIRSTRFSLLFFAGLALWGCGPDVSYNVPADPAKDAAEIGGGEAQPKLPRNMKKVTKPPGQTLRGAAVKSLTD